VKPSRPPAIRKGEIYFVTSATAERVPFFRYERWCALFVEVLYHYREESFHLHEFVVMPDHFHLLIAPIESLERAMQLIKGGFARKAALQFEAKQTIWQRGFTDHRIRDAADYDRHRHYIWQNPIKESLSKTASQYVYGSASGRYELDPVPQGLKPLPLAKAGGTAEAVPFPVLSGRVAEAAPAPALSGSVIKASPIRKSHGFTEEPNDYI
jgi:putative transposase